MIHSLEIWKTASGFLNLHNKQLTYFSAAQNVSEAELQQYSFPSTAHGLREEMTCYENWKFVRRGRINSML